MDQWSLPQAKKLSPLNFTVSSNIKVWWKCNKGHPSWYTSINSRTNGNNCPLCAKELQTSFPEQAIYHYLKKIIPDVENGYLHLNNKIKYEIDIFIPTYNIGIEYDGYRYHSDSNKIKNDELKNIVLSNAGIFQAVSDPGSYQ